MYEKSNVAATAFGGGLSFDRSIIALRDEDVQDSPKRPVLHNPYTTPAAKEGDSMNKQILVLAWAVAATAALADENPNWKDRPEPVKVNVVNGKIDVPEAIAPTEKTHGGLQWILTDASYQFSPGDGIVIDGQLVNGEIRPTDDWYKPCEMVKSDVHRFRCGKKQHTPGRYKYTVKVLDQDGNPVTKDPVILNY